MNTTIQRPTPKTDAAATRLCEGFEQCVSADFSRNLERERDEAREQLEAMRKERDELRNEILAANSSSEMELVQETQAQNIQLLEQVSRLIQEKFAMREAVKEAIPLLECLRGVHRHEQIEAALAKLQPFLKP